MQNIIVAEQKSYNCQEGSSFSATDNYIPLQDNIASCQEGTEMERNLMTRRCRKNDGFWTEKNTIAELKTVIVKLGHFPTPEELRNTNQTSLYHYICVHGGFNKFRELFGYNPIKRPKGFWTEERTIIELKKTIKELRHFPTQKNLREIGQSSLGMSIDLHGGTNKFRELLGYKLIHKSIGYWTEERITTELRKIIGELKKFPTKAELYAINRGDLVRATDKCGGFNKFRELLGHDYIKKPEGYWTFDETLKEIKAVMKELGHFPSHNELCIINRTDLSAAIKNAGGINKFREVTGYPVSLHEQHLAKSGSYSARRGKKTEELVKGILLKWCKAHGFPEPAYNEKLAPHNIIEFVCGVGKTIGIDVTNTKDKSGNSIRKKYRRKEYYKYVSELWIVVFSNAFKEKNYYRFNIESPDNVKVMSIDQFLKELGVPTEEHLVSKIEKYKKCTFCTKDEFIKRHKNRSLADFGGA